MSTAYHLLLPLALGGHDVVGLVRGRGAGAADAGVVGAAVGLQEPLVLLTDLDLQVESGFNQMVGGQGLHLGGVAGEQRDKFKNVSKASL